MIDLRAALTAALIGLVPGAALASVKVVTENGSVITGDIVSLQSGIYTIKTLYGTVTVPAASIKSIDSDAQGTATQASSSTGPLRLAGSTTIGDELAPALLEAYATSKGASDITWTQEGSAAEQLMEAKGPQNAAVTAHLSRHGSGTAFTALVDGKADIGMASRRINAQEIGKLTTAGLGDFSQPGLENVLALDGLIIAVNKSNPVNSLSISQIKDLFSGKVTDWSQVGGQAGPVHLFGRDTKSGTADTFNALVMGGAPVAAGVEVVEGSDGIALKVQGDPGAVGYVGFAYLGDNKALSIVTDCGIEFPASDLYVRTEEYPLSRRLYLYTPANATNAETRPFLDYALSDKGQDLAKKKNFIDLVPQTAPVQFARNEIALDLVSLSGDTGATREDMTSFINYSKHAVNGNRISTTFRFQFGSAALDARAVRDIDRLAEFLKSPAAANRNILIAGFADSVGTSLGSRQLAETRARAIAALLHGKGVDAKDVVGYGRVAPVACNTTPEGREKNRRVEVWLY